MTHAREGRADKERHYVISLVIGKRDVEERESGGESWRRRDNTFFVLTSPCFGFTFDHLKSTCSLGSRRRGHDKCVVEVPCRTTMHINAESSYSTNAPTYSLARQLADGSILFLSSQYRVAQPLHIVPA